MVANQAFNLLIPEIIVHNMGCMFWIIFMLKDKVNSVKSLID